MFDEGNIFEGNKLKNLVHKAYNKQNGNRLRQLVKIIANTYYYFPEDLIPYFEHEDPKVAAIASSAYQHVTGEFTQMLKLEYGGLGAVVKEIKDISLGLNETEEEKEESRKRSNPKQFQHAIMLTELMPTDECDGRWKNCQKRIQNQGCYETNNNHESLESILHKICKIESKAFQRQLKDEDSTSRNEERIKHFETWKYEIYMNEMEEVVKFYSTELIEEFFDFYYQSHPLAHEISKESLIYHDLIMNKKRLANSLECYILDLKDFSIGPFGDFTATKILGSGQQGKVYLLENELGAKITLKRMPEKIYEQESKILLEIQNLFSDKKRPHQNILQILIASDKDVRTRLKCRKKEPYHTIFVEYVDGKTIKELMQENPEGLPLTSATRYSLDLLDAIQYMCYHGVFHKDLHPENIKISKKNILKILDFGIASQALKDENRYNRKYGGSTDIFSWGLLTYKLFNGNHLLSNGKINEIEQRTEYAEAIKYQKSRMRNEDGTLIAPIREKITNSRLPENFKPQVIKSLEFIVQEDALIAGLEIQKQLTNVPFKTEIKTRLRSFRYKLHKNISKI